MVNKGSDGTDVIIKTHSSFKSKGSAIAVMFCAVRLHSVQGLNSAIMTWFEHYQSKDKILRTNRDTRCFKGLFSRSIEFV